MTMKLFISQYYHLSVPRPDQPSVMGTRQTHSSKCVKAAENINSPLNVIADLDVLEVGFN